MLSRSHVHMYGKPHIAQHTVQYIHYVKLEYVTKKFLFYFEYKEAKRKQCKDGHGIEAKGKHTKQHILCDMWKPTRTFTIIHDASEKRFNFTEKEEKRRGEWIKSNETRIFERFSFGLFRKCKRRPKSKIDWHEARHRQGNEMQTNTHQYMYKRICISVFHRFEGKQRNGTNTCRALNSEPNWRKHLLFLVISTFTDVMLNVEKQNQHKNTHGYVYTIICTRKTPDFHSDPGIEYWRVLCFLPFNNFIFWYYARNKRKRIC